MTDKELREIKRRFRPERSNIPRILGCFVNENKEIIYRIDQPLELSESLVGEKLLSVMKRTLSGSLGTSITDVSFTTAQVLQSEEHKLLTNLVKSHLSDKDALESFYTRVKESLNFEGNYVILLANDVYDVKSYSSDGEAEDSYRVFNYIVCAICPVKNLPEALAFRESDSLFHAFSASGVLSGPELGFMFPAFDDRQSNIYNALYYNRSISENHPAFHERIFGSAAKMPTKEQRETFGSCFSEALSGECSLQVVSSLHSMVDEMVAAHKESRNPEPLKINKSMVGNMLDSLGVDEKKIETLSQSFDESFGANAELPPKNLLPTSRFEISTPDVTVKVSPEHRDLVSTQVINNVKYVMIRVEGDVRVNDISINIDN